MKRTLTAKGALRTHDVSIVRNDTEQEELAGARTLPQLLAAVRRRRPRRRGGADVTFVVGHLPEFLAISTLGPGRYSGQHPIWGDADKFEGSMIFDGLTFADLERILTKFSDGRRAEGCFVPYDSWFQFSQPDGADSE